MRRRRTALSASSPGVSHVAGRIAAAASDGILSGMKRSLRRVSGVALGLVSVTAALVIATTAGCHRQQREGTTVRAWRTDALGRRALELASQDLSCRVAALTITAEGAGEYMVTGCSQEATYRCARDACIRAGGAVPSSRVVSGATASAWPDAVVRQMLQTIHDDVLACFETTHVPATVRVIMSRTGTISQHAIISDASDTEGRCVDAILSRVHLDGSTDRIPRTVVLSFAPRTQEITPSGSPTEPTADQAWDTEGSVRAALDAHAGTILVCTSGVAVAVAVTWTADGRATIGLRGRFAGSPEEGCVRQALADLRVSSGGRGGSILHPVQP
jgi:hypothetical protein